MYGAGQKVGLIQDAHLAAFLFDIQARAAAADDARLINRTVLEAGERALSRMRHGKPQEIGIVVASLQQWGAGDGGSFRTYLSAGRKIFNGKAAAADAAAEAAEEELTIGATVAAAEEHNTTSVSRLIDRLKLTDSPTMTWSVIRNQPPEGMSTPQLQAHQLFCDTVIDLLAFVGHTAGVERAGKAYPLIHTKLRKRLGADTLNMLVYIFHNMRLLYSEIQSDAPHFDDFGLGLLDEEQARVVDAELPALSTIPARIRDEPATRDGSQDDSSECESSECESSEGSDSSDSSDSGTTAVVLTAAKPPTVAPIPAVIWCRMASQQ